MSQQYPPLHILCMGETGTGKSTFATTFPKPMLVLFFDPLGKDMPYHKRHPLENVTPKVGQIQEVAIGDVIVPIRDIKRQDGVIRLEYYHSESPYHPNAHSRFMARMSVLHNEYDVWKTLVVDSTTFVELEARKWHQYELNPSAKDARQWYGGSKELLEEMLMMRFASLPMNVLVLTHIDEDKDELYGEIVRNPALPGKLGKRMASAFGEHYRMYCVRNEEGKLVRLLQTVNDGRYAAQTQIDAPDPCYPHYASLWENWGK